MGSNYLGGLGALWALRLNRWSVARVQMPGIFVFAVTQLLATLLHIPVFNWHHPIAWAWLFVYVTSPAATLLIYLTMEKGYRPPTNTSGSVPDRFKSVFLVFAIMSALFGVGLILWPFIYTAPDQGSAVPWWAWKLTPLTAHVAGGWYLASATLHYTLSRQRVIDTMGSTLLALIIVTGTQLLGAILWMRMFDGSLLFTNLYWLNSVAVFIFSAFIFFRHFTLFRG